MELMERTHRLFFALWPSDELRDHIASVVAPLVDGLRSRPIPARNFHVTLAFLGSIQARKLPSVMEAASQIVGGPFVLRIDRMEAWPGANILCLTPTPLPALSGLVDRLRFNLLARQVEVDQKEFRPHVTIAREWREARNAAIDAIEWHVDEFTLVESENERDGSHYRVIGRWPLRIGSN